MPIPQDHELRIERFKSAQEYFNNPPITPGERVASKLFPRSTKTEHLDYMDFAEIYADYVCAYEKANS